MKAGRPRDAASLIALHRKGGEWRVLMGRRSTRTRRRTRAPTRTGRAEPTQASDAGRPCRLPRARPGRTGSGGPTVLADEIHELTQTEHLSAESVRARPPHAHELLHVPAAEGPDQHPSLGELTE